MKTKNTIQCKSIPYSKICFSAESEITRLSKSTFNSKLFIDLDSPEETDYYKESNSDTNTEDSENSIEISQTKNDDDYYLSKELISELDSSSAPIQKRDSTNIMNSLLPLIENGYEFIPKNFKIPKNNQNKWEKKNDWICPFCRNLNFSFRVKCNRCGTDKGFFDNQKKITNYNFIW